jgi:hypothetical protein
MRNCNLISILYNLIDIFLNFLVLIGFFPRQPRSMRIPRWAESDSEKPRKLRE